MNTPTAPVRRQPRVIRTLIAGMLAALPLIATVALLSFAIGVVVNWVGPESALGELLGSLGQSLSGHRWSGYLVGVIATLILLYGLGVLVERGLSAWLISLVDSFVSRIPVVRTIYDTVERFVEIFSKRDKSELQAMRPVWCHFGGPGGVVALALLSCQEQIQVDGKWCYAILIPTAPVPIGGGLLFVPAEWVTPAEVGMEAVTSIYVSMGVTAPQFLSARRV